MKRKITLTVVSCILVLVTVGGAFAIHDAGVMMRGDITDSYVPHIAWAVEKYREDHDAYPKSIDELTSKSDDEIKEILKKELDTLTKLGLKMDYQLQTNGFSLVVTGIDSWRPRLDKVTRNLKTEEALHIFDAPANTVK